MAHLVIDNVSKRFGDLDVLKSISIDVKASEFLVLLGPSGCGKSTLLNMIAGLEPISDGEIRIDDKRINELSPKDRDIAMVFQSYALYPNMNVEQNMSFALEMRGIGREDRKRKVQQVAETLQISDLLTRRPGQLSGGQRQRVAMGRALVRDPKLFLFDEPLSNLDAKLRVEMRTYIKRLHQDLGITTVYVTHDQIEAMTLASHIAVMLHGELQQFGTPLDVYRSPANTFVASFIGSPPMNLIPARLEDAGNGLAATVGKADGGKAHLPLPEPPSRAADYRGRDIILGLRPEAIGDTTADGASRDTHHRLENRIEVIEPTGPDILVMQYLGGVEVLGRVDPGARIEPGETVALSYDMSRAVLFDAETQQRID